jgi:glutamyl-tRNA synthetase
MPRNEDVRFFDEIRGWVVVNTNNMDDKVIYKADGMPTYHLANVVDDYLMEISHVIRGEEWLPSAPLHVLLYKYLDLEKAMPKFAHLPLILKPDGNGKLSKRDGDRLGFPVFPLQWTDPVTKEVSSGYREKGYFPESFVNMLAFLGWNPGNSKELYTMEELIKDFSLERVGKSGAKFDPEKSKWFNQQHLRNKSNSELAHLMLLDCKYNVSNAFLEKVANLMKERATFHHELLSEEYFFKIFEEYDEKTFRKKWKSNTLLLVNEFFADLELVESFLSNQIENTFQKFIEKKEIGMGALLPCLRLILTGKGMGPSLFSIMELLGKQEVMHRYNIKSTLFENLFLEKSNS